MNKEKLKKEFSDLYSEINLNSLLNKIAYKIRNYLGCEESAIFLYDSLKEELYFEIATGKKQNKLKHITLRKGEGVVGWIAEHKKSVIINNCSEDPRFSSKADSITKFKTRSIVGLPVNMDEQLIGVIEAINKIDGEFDNNDRDLLGEISNYISIPLQNAVLFRELELETKEKDRLIELGKVISSSFSLDEVFNTLRKTISEIITPQEMRVFVKSQKKLYHLIGEKENLSGIKISDKTDIRDNSVVFPLRTKNKALGFLEVKFENRILDEIVSLIKGIAVFAAISIEKFEMVSQMIEKEKIEKELQIARDIQQSFLLSKKVDLKGVDVSYINIPSSRVGGDYYDIFKVNEHETIFTINDVSGHGIPASLLMSIFRTNFVYRIKKDNDILTTISHLNNIIAKTTDSNLFVTSFTLLVDVKNMKASYINAGHNPPFILRGNKILDLKESSIVVGLFPDSPYTIAEVELKKNDLIIMYTDGIIEAENSRGEQYSLKRMIDFVKARKNRGTEIVKKNFIAELKNFTKRDNFEDDITFIIIKITQ